MAKAVHHLAASDEQLAIAERTEHARQQAALEEQADRDEQQRLAEAGEPEAEQAVRAIASLQESQPVEHESPPVKPPPKRRDQRKYRKVADEFVSPLVVGDEPNPRKRTETDAFKLMDAAFRKWRAGAAKDLRRANRELARDLLGDGAIYLQNNILKLSELLDATVKLNALAKPREDDPDENNVEDELEDLRKSMRGSR